MLACDGTTECLVVRNGCAIVDAIKQVAGR
jgi:hypothetical protein